ncbi:P-loop containing nucleoside triphosphate hydrolase protein [Ephemerocybe angulata]|uniref:P-loop containing nucleoside triphosphate hydrolase protein n=1 Tax=Ephemerocybe angulata TaxID=980116 RepID=A0A8H6M0E2_9AGAR|nr:P-loop containing nucleoside triphosphate hydrolase protein [Tulosesus angulatus]
MPEPVKKKGYAHRTSMTISAPPEVDPDSDFVAGAYIEEPKTKLKAKKLTKKRGSAPAKAVALSDDEYAPVKKTSSHKAKAKQPRPYKIHTNVLRDLFAGELVDGEIISFTSSEEESEDEVEEEQPEPLATSSKVPLVQGGPSVSDEVEPGSLKRKASPVLADDPSTKRLKLSGQGGSSLQAGQEPDEGSVTEPESEPETSKAVVKPSLGYESGSTEDETEPEAKPNLPAKAKEFTWESGSTEPESDVEPVQKANPPAKEFTWESGSTEPESDDAQTQKPKVLANGYVYESGSTEPESDEEQTQKKGKSLSANAKARVPKPNFPLKPGQTRQPALVLDEKKKVQVPASINTYLRGYQREGVQFLYNRYAANEGGLLGDDMGLGKTVQIAAFLSAIMGKEGVSTDIGRRRKWVSDLQDTEPLWKTHRRLPRDTPNKKWPTALIIAPKTVCLNWEKELETWGYFDVGVYMNGQKQKDQTLRDFELGRLDVVITTPQMATRDAGMLYDLAWSCIIFDEVHGVKDPKAQLTRALESYTCPVRIGMTGTAIQNSYMEMWTILNWTNPGKVGDQKQWRQYIERPLTRGQSASASEEERAKAMVVARVLKTKLLPQYFLRRSKSIIADQLPKKYDQVVFCPLTRSQILVYKKILDMEAIQNLMNRDKPCPCGSKKSLKACCHPYVTGDLFKFMSILIKLSNHLGLIVPGPNDPPEQLKRSREITDAIFPSGNAPTWAEAVMNPDHCGKWKTLESLLSQWRKDKTNKVLIFTKSVKLLEMLDFHLNYKSYPFVKLDGSTKQSDRMPLIDQFNSDPDLFIFLISTLAGGTGLNLTAANKVVIFDPNWNPAQDLQAKDRAFRIGQTRDVTVCRLLAAGTIEELIYARQIYKQQQMAIGYDASVQTRYFKGVQGDSSKRGELFGMENIFKLQEKELATKMAIEKANLAELDWAMANLEAKGRKGKKNADVDVFETAAKKGKEDDLRGLGALLLDDAVPTTAPTEKDVLKKLFDTIGVKYTHDNDDLFKASNVERERAKQTIQKVSGKRKKADPKGKKASSAKAPAESKPAPAPWPPLRGAAKRRAQQEAATHPVARPAPPPPAPTPRPKPKASTTEMEARLAARYSAAVKLGIINSPADLPRLAAEFVKMDPAKQEKLLAEFDEYMSTSEDEDEEDDEDEDEDEEED